jgi:hypothetical protein
MTLAKPEVILTHESDLDGLVSGLLLQRLARHLFQSEILIEAYHYQGWKMRQMSESVAWVSDFSFDPRLDRPNWMVLDHHTGDFRPRQAKLIHDVTQSAAKLCYEILREHGLATPALDRLVHLTHVGDLFIEGDPDFMEACDYGSLVKHYGFWNIHAVIAGNPEALVDHPLLEVMRLSRRIEDPIGYRLALEDVVELSPTVGMVKPPIGNTNLIVHEILNQGATKYPVIATLYRRGAGVYVASFRSLNGEALAAAQRFEGGGGHPNAAGATLPRMSGNDAALQFLKTRLGQTSDSAHGLNSFETVFSGLQWPQDKR